MPAHDEGVRRELGEHVLLRDRAPPQPAGRRAQRRLLHALERVRWPLPVAREPHLSERPLPTARSTSKSWIESAVRRARGEGDCDDGRLLSALSLLTSGCPARGGVPGGCAPPPAPHGGAPSSDCAESTDGRGAAVAVGRDRARDVLREQARAGGGAHLRDLRREAEHVEHEAHLRDLGAAKRTRAIATVLAIARRSPWPVSSRSVHTNAASAPELRTTASSPSIARAPRGRSRAGRTARRRAGGGRARRPPASQRTTMSARSARTRASRLEGLHALVRRDRRVRRLRPPPPPPPPRRPRVSRGARAARARASRRRRPRRSPPRAPRAPSEPAPAAPMSRRNASTPTSSLTVPQSAFALTDS